MPEAHFLQQLIDALLDLKTFGCFFQESLVIKEIVVRESRS